MAENVRSSTPDGEERVAKRIAAGGGKGKGGEGALGGALVGQDEWYSVAWSALVVNKESK